MKPFNPLDKDDPRIERLLEDSMIREVTWEEVAKVTKDAAETVLLMQEINVLKVLLEWARTGKDPS